jgi:hypothetical protein
MRAARKEEDMVIRIAVVAGVLAGAAGAYAVAGARFPATTVVAQSEKAAITLRLTVGDSAPIVAKGVEGTAMRLGLPDGTWLEFIPALVDGALEVTIREEEAPDGAKDQVLRLDQAHGAFDVEHGIQIDWLSTDPPPIREAGLRGPCTTCSVTMACGSCACDGGCAASQPPGLRVAPANTRSKPGVHGRTTLNATKHTLVVRVGPTQRIRFCEAHVQRYFREEPGAKIG